MMRTEIDLKQIERKAWRACFQDGIWEIFFGAFLIGIAFSPMLPDIGIPTPLNFFLPLSAALILWAGKRFVTAPRLGFVEFGPKRKADRKKLRVVMIVAFLATLALLILTVTNVFQPAMQNVLGGYAFPTALGLFVLMVFSITAYFKDYLRLYVYGVMMSAGAFLAVLLGQIPAGLIVFGATGAIILLIGLVLLVLFLRKYPLPAGDTTDEQ